MIFMGIFGPLLISTIAGLSTVVGGLIVYLKIKNKEEFITTCLSFSLSVMIMISIIELIPESSYSIVRRFGYFYGFIILIIVFLLGMISVNYINNKINKTTENCCENSDKNLFRVGVLSMIALMLHNFPEGIATFMSAYKDLNLGISLGLAIMMHNIPEGISIAVPIYYSTHSKRKGVVYSLISGLAEPIGAIMTYLIFKKYITNISLSIVLILVAGIMITLSINKLFPEVLKYNKKKNMIIGMSLGVVVVLINHFLL